MNFSMLRALIVCSSLVGFEAFARVNPQDDPALRHGRDRGAKTEAISLDAEAPGCPCKDQTRISMMDSEHTGITRPVGATGEGPAGPKNVEQGQ